MLGLVVTDSDVRLITCKTVTNGTRCRFRETQSHCLAPSGNKRKVANYSQYQGNIKFLMEHMNRGKI